MANIELVIKIDENIYRRLKSGNYGLLVSNTCAYEVLNGTPLPKGHGRLFDERDIINGSNYEDIGNRLYVLKPIIEADKGDKDADSN